MPIVNGHAEYEIPKDIKSSIPDYFYIALAGELCSILGPQLFEKQTAVDGTQYYDFNSGTGAWDEAFDMTCRKLNMTWLAHYRNSLEWYEGDMFDSQIEVGIVKHFCETKPSRSNAYYRYLCWANITCDDFNGMIDNVDDLIQDIPLEEEKNKQDLSDDEAFLKYLESLTEELNPDNKKSNYEALLELVESITNEPEESSDEDISSRHKMDRTKLKIISLFEDTENGTAGEFVCGWNSALKEVLKLF